MSRPFPDHRSQPLFRYSSGAGRIALILSIAMGLFSCASPTILSGEDLLPEERSQLRAKRGVKFLQIDEKEADGRWLVLKPGTYAIEFFSAQDAKSVNGALGGVIDELTCKIDLELLAGEEVFLTSRLKKGAPRFSGGYSNFDFHTEISVDSSIDGRSSEVNATECKRRVTCKKVDRTQVAPVGCD